MAYDEHLGTRISRILTDKKVSFIEKKMFGGVAFMVNDKMCIGIIKDDLMARVGPEAQDAALAKPHVRIMDFAARPMEGYLYVAPAGVDSDADLEYWVDMCLAFNPLAKAARKKSKKK